MITFEIPSSRAADARDAFAKLAKKATKLGVAIPTMTLGDEQTKTISKTAPSGETKTVVVTFRVVEVSEEPIVLPGGWMLDGTITPTEAGNLVTTAPGRTIAATYRAEDGSRCDHCQTIRRRKVTHVVSNAEGVTMRVGASCIRDFLSGYDPKALERRLQWARDLAALANEDAFGGFGERDTRESLAEILTVTALVIRSKGWLSKGEANKINDRERGEGNRVTSTSSHVATYLYDVSKYGAEFRRELGPVTDADRAEAGVVIAWARDVEGSNDYVANLRILARLGAIEPKFFGIAVSMLAAYRKATEKVIERAELAKTSDFIGVEGKRETFTLTVLRSYLREGQFGTTDILTMTDAAGNVVTWFASSAQGLKEGDVVTGKATVKRHALDRGVKTTTIARFTYEIQSATSEAVA